MRRLTLLLVAGVTVLSCTPVREVLVKSGIEVATRQPPLTVFTGDTLELGVSLTNVSDSTIELVVAELTFRLIDYPLTEYTGDVIWAYNVCAEPSYYRLEPDSQINVSLKFVEVIPQTRSGKFLCKVWYGYRREVGEKLIRYSFESRDPFLVEVGR